MTINVECACGKKYRVKPEQQGKTLRCPACQQFITVPTVADEPMFIEDEPASLPAWSPSPRRAEQESGQRPPSRRSTSDASADSDVVFRESSSAVRYEKPHQGGQVLGAAIFGLFCFGIIIGPVVALMATYHLHLMNQGRMDPAGKTLTIIGLVIAIFDIFGAILAFWLMSKGAVPGLQ